MIEARLFAYRLLDELAEDIGFLDLSTLGMPRRRVHACVVARDEGIAAGVSEAVEFLRLLGFRVVHAVGDGERIGRGSRVLCFEGEAPDVLKVERTLLNVLMRASGIATETRRIVERARSANPNVRVAATRKTAPFLRYLDKKAVIIGGGDPHRYSLSDAVMIKDNHVAVSGDMEKALSYAYRPFTARVEVEVGTVDEAISAAQRGIDVIMLDNMSPEEVAEVHRRLTEMGIRGRVLLEASGGIGSHNVERYAPYVDVVSIGALTHSPRALDMGMDVYTAPSIGLGLVGAGAIGRAFADLIRGEEDVRITHVHDVDGAKCAELAGSIGARCTSLDELVDAVDIVVEAASPEFVRESLCRMLEKGKDVVVMSAAGLLGFACEKWRGRVYVPSGAAGGLDVLAALDGAAKVRHRVRKGVEAFGGAGTMCSGSPSDVAGKYPRSANSSAALHLAGAEVHVELVGEEGRNEIVHEIGVESPYTTASIVIANKALGPRTSALAAMSLAAMVRSIARMRLGRARLVVGTFAVS